MAKDKRTLSDQEREQRRAEQLRSTDGWQAYLKVRSRFHSYSVII